MGLYISVPELPKPVLGRSDMKVDMYKIGYAYAHTMDIEVLDSPGDASTQKVTLHGVYQGLIFLLTHRVIGMGWVGETSMTPTMAPRPGLRAVRLAVPGHGLCRWWRPLCCHQGVSLVEIEPPKES